MFKKEKIVQSIVKPSFQKLLRRVVRLRAVHWLLSCHHPVAVDAACVDIHVELLLLLLVSTAVAAGATGIATAGIARLPLTQIAGCSYSIVSAVVVFLVGMVINKMSVSSFLLLIHGWRIMTLSRG